MMTGWIALTCAAALGISAPQDMVSRPAVQTPLPPPPSTAPVARVGIADYRYDDLLWENDRIAFRIYSRKLEAAEPPSTSGIDVWGKNVRWPFMDRQLRAGDQHVYRGEGIDFYNVGSGRGAGGLGIWHDNKLWTSRNYSRARILDPGPTTARFTVDYAPWPVDLARTVSETRSFALPVGSNFTRMVSTIRSNSPAPLVVGIGIGRRATTGDDPVLTVDRARGIVSLWGPADPVKGRIAVAVAVDPASLADVVTDGENHLLLVRAAPGRPFVYYVGAAWDKGLDFHMRTTWEDYVKAQAFDFDPAR